MKKKVFLRFLSLVLIISLLFNVPVVSYAKSEIRLNKTSVTLTIGSSVNLKVKNTTKKVKWSSSNKSVAEVYSDGEVCANNAGKAKITAKVGNKKYTCKIEVLRQYISNDTILLNVGDSKSLRVFGISKDDIINWGSDDEDIAVVSDNGRVTALKSGETNVYAMLNGGIGETYECKVIVTGGDISPNTTVKPTPSNSQNHNNTVTEFGSVSGNITYFYNKFRGNVSDTGAQIILIPLDSDRTGKNMPNLNSYVVWKISTLNRIGNPYKVYNGKVDGVGSYTLQNIATGKYIIFVISERTTSGSAFNDLENYKSEIKELVLPCLNTTNSEYLAEAVGYNKYFWGIITVNKNQTTIFSHDFGITYI